MNKSKIIGIVMVIALAGVLVWGIMYAYKVSNKPGVYTEFAKCLKDKGLTFFGAFWCPHCQAEKKLFGSAVKELPYVECSNPDNSQNQTCKDNHIEGYPTWVYPNEVSIESTGDPIICEKQPGPAGQPDSCTNLGSEFMKSWIFGIVNMHSEKEPVHTGTTWTFAPGSRSTGEVTLENLSKFSSCPLPAQQ